MNTYFPVNLLLHSTWKYYTDSASTTPPITNLQQTSLCFSLGRSLISLRAKKQQTISSSSSEAEYRALSSATCELQWIMYLLQDLHVICTKLPLYIVIHIVQYTLPLTQSSMRGPSILKLTATLSEKRFKREF
jgi:hypothetical protein